MSTTNEDHSEEACLDEYPFVERVEVELGLKFVYRYQLTFKELTEQYQTYCKELPGHRLLFSMYDVRQMLYTSMHATQRYDLDTDAMIDEGEPYHVCPTKLREAFLDFVKEASFDSACERLDEIEDEELDRLVQYTKDPDQIVDERSAIYAFPAMPDDPWALALYGLPNGYFSSDLDPAENYAVALRFEQRYQYRLVGMGSCLLAFHRQGKLSAKQEGELLEDLLRLYGSPKSQSARDKLLDQIRSSEYLLFKYVEYLECWYED